MKVLLGTAIVMCLGFQAFAEGNGLVQRPVVPQFETCPYVKVDNYNGGTYQTQDAACLGRNTEKQKNN